MTEYRSVPGFPGYRVGDDGSVQSRWRKCYRGCKLGDVWKSLAGGLDKDGYRKLILCAKGERRYVRVNVLVLEVFCGPCPADGMTAAHSNNIKTDNRLSNLRWATQKSNIADKKLHGTHQAGEKNPSSKLTIAQVAEIRARQAKGERGTDLAKEYGVKAATIGAVWTGRNWKPSFSANVPTAAADLFGADE